MKRAIYIYILTVLLFQFFAFRALAQGCGTNMESQEIQLEKMLENRRNAGSLLSSVQRSGNDTMYYVPIVFHICGENNGIGYVPLENVFGSLCKINRDYANLNIQFYIQEIRYIPNDFLYNHGPNSGDPMAVYWMSVNKIMGALNIFIGRTVAPTDQFLAYYTNFNSLDVIYTFKTGVGFNNPTLTHEIGHFFTLPHTFYGWEGTSYSIEAVTGKAPAMVGGRPVEKTVRGAAGENCQIAGDRFCDTPADYSSDRANCPQSPFAMYDPDSMALAPDDRNFMSYFNDPCLSTFSQEQGQAIKLDFVARGYHNLPTPSPLIAVGTPSLVWPDQGAMSTYQGPMQFRWTKADTASRYWVQIHQSLPTIPTSLGLKREFYTADTFVWTTLPSGFYYYWTVKSMTQYDVCNTPISSPVIFRTEDWGIPINHIPFDDFKVSVMPNPSQSDRPLHIKITSPENCKATLHLTDISGKMVLAPIPLVIDKGENIHYLDNHQLAAGFYILAVETFGIKYCYKLVVTQ